VSRALGLARRQRNLSDRGTSRVITAGGGFESHPQFIIRAERWFKVKESLEKAYTRSFGSARLCGPSPRTLNAKTVIQYCQSRDHGLEWGVLQPHQPVVDHIARSQATGQIRDVVVDSRNPQMPAYGIGED
jgi:hypothetical protein